MKKYLFLHLAIFTLLLNCTSHALATTGDTGAATAYKVTIEQFEMFNGTSWVTVSSGNSTTIDIAAVNSGSAAGTFFAGLNVPDGSYTQVRVTVSSTFTISGSVSTDGSAIYSTAALANGVCVSSSNASNQAQCAVSVPGGLPAPTPDVLPSTLTVTGGVPSHKIRVNFNVSAAVQETAGEGIAPGQPTVTMQMIAL